MERFCLSARMIADALNGNVRETHFNFEGGPSITHVELYEPDIFRIRRDCVYLCLDGELPPRKRMERGGCLICDEKTYNPEEGDYGNCDVVVVEGLSRARIANTVSELLERKMSWSRQIELLAREGGDLTDILEASEKLTGLSLCVLDVNQDTIATSSKTVELAHPLWDTVVQEDKPLRSDILDHCKALPHDLCHPLHSGTTQILDIAGWSTYLHNLDRRGRPAMSLWAFKSQPSSPLRQGEIEQLEWVTDELELWLAKQKKVLLGRGRRSERYLIDILEGAFCNDWQIIDAGKQVGCDMEACPEHILLILQQATDKPRPDELIKNLEAAEKLFPQALWAISGCTIVALFGADECSYLPEADQHILEKYCRQKEYYGMLGTPFVHLSDAPKVLQQLTDCFTYLDPLKTPIDLYHYYNFAVVQSMNAVIRMQPVETMLHPVVRKILKYDKDNSTDYLDTLETYLTFRCNVTDTAKQLHMHRNTLQHRIKKIEEIGGRSFDDWSLRRAILFSNDYLKFVHDEFPTDLRTVG